MWLAVLPIIRVMFCHDHFSIIIIVLIIINVMELRAGPKKLWVISLRVLNADDLTVVSSV